MEKLIGSTLVRYVELLAKLQRAFARVRPHLVMPRFVEDGRGLHRAAQISSAGIVLTIFSYLCDGCFVETTASAILHLTAIALYVPPLVLRLRASTRYPLADRIFCLSLAYGLGFFPWFGYLSNPGSAISLAQVLTSFAFVLLIYPLPAALVCYAIGVGGVLAFALGQLTMGIPLPNSVFEHFPLLVLNSGALMVLKYFSDRNVKDRIMAVKAITDTIAHEMRTPMQSIEMSCDGLMSTFGRFLTKTLSPQQQEVLYTKVSVQTMTEAIKRIQSEAVRMHRELNLLLQNASAPNAAPVDVCTVDSVASLVKEYVTGYPFYSPSDVNLVELRLENDFRARVSPFVLDHVIINLMKNALHSIARAKKGAIEIRLEFDPRRRVNQLIFRDTGAGISKSDLANIFLPFYTTRINGTGLGLAFSRRALALFGSEISVNSVEGEYAEFIISFPTVEPRRDNATHFPPDHDDPA